MDSHRIESGSPQANRNESDPEIAQITRSAISYAENAAQSEHATRWSPDAAINHVAHLKDSLGEERWRKVKDAILAAPKKVVSLSSFTKRRRH
jgi:hypothetical protein